jgi:nucleoside-diphosphate-sugar epimerase
MKVLVAGATGAIGVPLVRALVSRGHQVAGLTRRHDNAERLVALGAEPVVADAMDRDRLLAAVEGMQADAVVHELTALKKPPARHRDMAATDALRTQGTANLLAAARTVGARRFVTQSMILGYGYGDHGAKLLTEHDPFAPTGRGRFEPHLAALRSAEQQTFTADGIQGVALRYGLIYGDDPATRTLVALLRRRRLVLPRDGGGTMSWIYLDDDQPVRWRDFLGALARAVGAPPPRTMPGWLFPLVPYTAAMLTSTLRVSNAKAKTDLAWQPSAPTYRDGIARITATLQPQAR